MDNNFGNFNSLYDFLEAFPTEAVCIAYLENKRWKNGVISPYDTGSKVYKRGDGCYRCKTLVRISMSVLVLFLRGQNYH